MVSKFNIFYWVKWQLNYFMNTLTINCGSDFINLIDSFIPMAFTLWKRWFLTCKKAIAFDLHSLKKPKEINMKPKYSTFQFPVNKWTKLRKHKPQTTVSIISISSLVRTCQETYTSNSHRDPPNLTINNSLRKSRSNN